MTPLVAAAFQAVLLSAPQLHFEGGYTCDDSMRANAIVVRHTPSLPSEARVTMAVAPEGNTGRVVVEVSVVTDGETRIVERQFIHSCEEAFAYLDFYLSVWEPEQMHRVDAAARGERGRAVGASVAGRDETLAGDAMKEQSSPFEPPSFLAGAFAHATTNHSSGVGFGAGAALDMTLDTVRLGAFGTWNQPSLLQGEPSKATYLLHRFDIGGQLCAKAWSSPILVWPCLGVSARRFSIEKNEAAPEANLDATVASADATLMVAKAITDNTALEAALAFRHAMSDLDIGRFQVGSFTPASFEATFRLGLTWDIAGTVRDAPSSQAESVAAREQEQSWQ